MAPLIHVPSSVQRWTRLHGRSDPGVDVVQPVDGAALGGEAGERVGGRLGQAVGRPPVVGELGGVDPEQSQLHLVGGPDAVVAGVGDLHQSVSPSVMWVTVAVKAPGGIATRATPDGGSAGASPGAPARHPRNSRADPSRSRGTGRGRRVRDTVGSSGGGSSGSVRLRA